MSRNASGVYSLAAGNPVVTGTIISSAWANNTLSDLALAMTDSLSRSGLGGMLAPFKAVDGTIGTPGISFNNETTAGIYRAGPGDFRFSVAGADVFKFSPSGGGFANSFTIDGIAPALIYNETDQAINERFWRAIVDAKAYTIQATDDTLALPKNAFKAIRGAGSIISGLEFGNATDNTTFNFLGTGAGTSANPWTWTGQHEFRGAVTRGTANNYLSVGATGGFSFVSWGANAAPANERNWVAYAAANSSWNLAAETEDVSQHKVALHIRRTNTAAITLMDFGNATDNPTYNFLGTGAATFNGNVVSSSTIVPGMRFFANWPGTIPDGNTVSFGVGEAFAASRSAFFYFSRSGGNPFAAVETFGSGFPLQLNASVVTYNGIEVGYRGLEYRASSASFAIQPSDNGKSVEFNGGSGQTITIPAGMPQAAMVTILNGSSSAVTLQGPIANSFYWFAGLGQPGASTTRILAPGGVATIVQHLTSNIYRIWGIGLS